MEDVRGASEKRQHFAAASPFPLFFCQSGLLLSERKHPSNPSPFVCLRQAGQGSGAKCDPIGSCICIYRTEGILCKGGMIPLAGCVLYRWYCYPTLKGKPLYIHRNIFPKIFKNQNPYLYYSLKKVQESLFRKISRFNPANRSETTNFPSQIL